MSSPWGEKKPAKQTFGGPLCFRKATELVISPSYSVLWREATLNSQPLGTMRGWTWPGEWSNHTHLLVLLLFTVLVCTLFSVIAVPYMVLPFPGLSWDSAQGLCLKTCPCPRGSPAGKCAGPIRRLPPCRLGSWSFLPPPPPVDGRKGVWCQVLLPTSAVSQMSPRLFSPKLKLRGMSITHSETAPQWLHSRTVVMCERSGLTC